MRMYLCNKCDDVCQEDNWNRESEHKLPNDLYFGIFTCPSCGEEVSEEDIEAI